MENGGSASIWRTFSHTPGKIAYGDNGDVACDAYHRYAEDIALLKELSVKAYRFSTSWARIDPCANGRYRQTASNKTKETSKTSPGAGDRQWERF